MSDLIVFIYKHYQKTIEYEANTPRTICTVIVEKLECWLTQLHSSENYVFDDLWGVQREGSGLHFNLVSGSVDYSPEDGGVYYKGGFLGAVGIEISVYYVVISVV